MGNALKSLYRVNFVFDVPEWPDTEKKTQLTWPVEYFNQQKVRADDLLQLWRFLWPQYTPGANDAKFFFQDSKVLVDSSSHLADCPTRNQIIKISCMSGSSKEVRTVYLENILVK